MKIKLAAVVIFYNPDENVVENISSYLSDVEKLYVIDNSSLVNEDLVEHLTAIPKITYIKPTCNIGVASALNMACEQAISEGYGWLLTMDQDSVASRNMIQILSSQIYDDTETAIVSPYHANKVFPQSDSKNVVSKKTSVMTSGNLLNLKLYPIIGRFTDELFIDFVDHDYCLRANLHNFTILQVNNAVLKHNLGNLRKHKFFNRTFYSTNHPPIRKYYQFRNRAYIIKRYNKDFPVFCKRELRRFITDFFVIILFEQQKILKTKMMLTGLKDFFKNNMGPYNA